MSEFAAGVVLIVFGLCCGVVWYRDWQQQRRWEQACNNRFIYERNGYEEWPAPEADQ